MTLSDELTWRGFVNQMTFSDIADVNEPRTLYYGVDPSASSMHIGQLSNAMMIRHFMDRGHKVILLVGGATGMIGDPGGKNEERQLKSLDEVNSNKQAIARQYKTLFDGQAFDVVDNYDWFKDIGYLEFLRDVGKHFSMTQLLDRDFIKSRIGKDSAGISYAEFSYGLIQGYDFLHLFRTKKATLQIAGSDQWGNSISGVEMIRKLEGETAHVWTAPLILDKTTGTKFGKSEGNAIWLDPELTSPFKFYQFWLNTDDEGVIDYLKVYTLLDKDAIDTLEKNHQTNPGSREAQRILAKLVTGIVHGGEKAQQMEDITRMLFGEVRFEDLLPEDMDVLAAEIPTTGASQLVEALVSSGVATSNGEARRLIDGGAISVNGEKVSADVALVAPSLIKKGKNSFILVR